MARRPTIGERLFHFECLRPSAHGYQNGRLIIAASSRFHEDEIDRLEASSTVSAPSKRSNSPGLGSSETPFFDVFRSGLEWVPWLGDKPIRLGK